MLQLDHYMPKSGKAVNRMIKRNAQAAAPEIREYAACAYCARKLSFAR